MPYYNECPLCGSTLDPGEKCDCELPQSPCGSSLREGANKKAACVELENANGNPKRESSSDTSISQE